MSVKENVLLNTSAVTFESYKDKLENSGCGWLCEDATGKVVGFSIVDLTSHNIWALFVHPDFEGIGIGSNLHQVMLDYSFEHGAEYLYLTTDPGTRAESFYLKAGWEMKGKEPDGEVRLEITKAKWLCSRKASA